MNQTGGSAVIPYLNRHIVLSQNRDFPPHCDSHKDAAPSRRGADGGKGIFCLKRLSWVFVQIHYLDKPALTVYCGGFGEKFWVVSWL